MICKILTIILSGLIGFGLAYIINQYTSEAELSTVILLLLILVCVGWWDKIFKIK